jgi:hypothetical protein
MSSERDDQKLAVEPEAEDKTDYQALDDRGRPKVLGQAEAEPDNVEVLPNQIEDRLNEQMAVGNAGTSDGLSEEGLREICREAMRDARSIDPEALLFEILVRLRTRAGAPDARRAIPVEYNSMIGETYWKEIDEIVKNRFKADYDVKAVITDAIEQNSELKEL